MSEDTLRYAGFWPRLGAALLDVVVLAPLTAFNIWGGFHFRLFEIYSYLPEVLFWLCFSVYLVKRFGGTPGKLLMGLRIRKLNGESVGYREAFLRYVPYLVIDLLSPVGQIVAVLRMSAAEYYASSYLERNLHLQALTPGWCRWLDYLMAIWMLAEIIVFFSNRKRRAIHDYIAGTVVVHVRPEAKPVAAAAVSE
ncbi:hypothetical protein BH09VER1_BH09VER1_54430 [soil metagenome]